MKKWEGVLVVITILVFSIFNPPLYVEIPVLIYLFKEEIILEIKRIWNEA